MVVIFFLNIQLCFSIRKQEMQEQPENISKAQEKEKQAKRDGEGGGSQALCVWGILVWGAPEIWGAVTLTTPHRNPPTQHSIAESGIKS